MYVGVIFVGITITITIILAAIYFICKGKGFAENADLGAALCLIGALLFCACPGVIYQPITKDVWHRVERKYTGEHYSCSLFSCVAITDYYVYLEDYGEYEVSRETYYKVDTNWCFKITYRTGVVYVWEEEWR